MKHSHGFKGNMLPVIPVAAPRVAKTAFCRGDRGCILAESVVTKQETTKRK
jgi:hypothetical protein